MSWEALRLWLKPLVKADIDKIEYNVQDDPDSKPILYWKCFVRFL